MTPLTSQCCIVVSLCAIKCLSIYHLTKKTNIKPTSIFSPFWFLFVSFWACYMILVAPVAHWPHFKVDLQSFLYLFFQIIWFTPPVATLLFLFCGFLFQPLKLSSVECHRLEFQTAYVYVPISSFSSNTNLL